MKLSELSTEAQKIIAAKLSQQQEEWNKWTEIENYFVGGGQRKENAFLVGCRDRFLNFDFRIKQDHNIGEAFLEWSGDPIDVDLKTYEKMNVPQLSFRRAYDEAVKANNQEFLDRVNEGY